MGQSKRSKSKHSQLKSSKFKPLSARVWHEWDFLNNKLVQIDQCPKKCARFSYNFYRVNNLLNEILSGYICFSFKN